MTSPPESDQRAEIFGLARARLSPQGVVAELGEAALGDLEIDRLFDLATHVLCDVLDAEYSSVILRAGGGELSVGAVCGWDDAETVATMVGEASSLVEFALSAMEPVVVTDLGGERRFEPWPLLVDSSVLCGLTVAIPGHDDPFGVLSVHTSHRRGFSADDTDFLRSVAHILGGRLQADADRRLQDRGLRYQVALTECAHALLVGSGDGGLEKAAGALLMATDAESVFIERNTHHPELGFCSETVAEADRPGSPASEVDEDYDYWDLVPWEHMPISRSYLERGEPFVVLPEELEGVEYEVYAADPFPLKSELDIPIFTNGEWAGVIAFSESAEARDWAEEELSLLMAAAQMVGTFWETETANEQLRRLVESKDQLIASVSHELRTPLTSVVGFARLLEIEDSDLDPEERAMVVRTIAEEGVDLANLIDDLLVAAKAESGTLAVVSVSIDLRAQAAQVVEACRPEDAARIAVSCEDVRAVGDPARVRQILRNLISNALKYGGEEIRVGVKMEGDNAVVSVVDNGPGIAPQDQDRVFESYYRGEGDPGLAGSMGLGLTISKELARLMDGSLIYRYDEGESIFELRLPRMDWQL